MPNASEQRSPIVSIVLPTLNGARYIAEAIDSVLSQTCPDFELIVVDGGSKDGTLEIVSHYHDPRISVVSQPPDSGRLPGALNLGFAHAKGEFLTWFQDDDKYEPEALEVMLSFLSSHPNVDFVYTDGWLIDENGQTIRRIEVLPPEHLRKTNGVWHCFLYRKRVSDTIGEYDVGSFLMEDYDYWLRILLSNCRMEICPVLRPLHYHRFQPSALTSTYSVNERCRVLHEVQRKLLGDEAVPTSRLIARVHIGWAFACHLRGDAKGVRRYVPLALRYDPSLLTNLGVVSIFGESLIGHRLANIVRRSIRRITLATRPIIR